MAGVQQVSEVSELAHDLAIELGVNEHSKALDDYIRQLNKKIQIKQKRHKRGIWIKEYTEEPQTEPGELSTQVFLDTLTETHPQTAEKITKIIQGKNKGITINASSAFIKLKQMEKEKLVRTVSMTFNRIGWVKV